jgi:hypothetical protein
LQDKPLTPCVKSVLLQVACQSYTAALLTKHC